MTGSGKSGRPVGGSTGGGGRQRRMTVYDRLEDARVRRQKLFEERASGLPESPVEPEERLEEEAARDPSSEAQESLSPEEYDPAPRLTESDYAASVTEEKGRPVLVTGMVLLLGLGIFALLLLFPGTEPPGANSRPEAATDDPSLSASSEVPTNPGVTRSDVGEVVTRESDQASPAAIASPPVAETLNPDQTPFALTTMRVSLTGPDVDWPSGSPPAASRAVAPRWLPNLLPDTNPGMPFVRLEDAPEAQLDARLARLNTPPVRRPEGETAGLELVEATPDPELSRLDVVLHFPNRVSPDDARALATNAADAGFAIEKLIPAAFTISRTNIRYFHAEDRDPAETLADVIGGELRDFTNFRPSPAVGVIEIWMAGSGVGVSSGSGLSQDLQRLQDDIQNALDSILGGN